MSSTARQVHDHGPRPKLETLPLHNELIYEILEYLPNTVDIRAVGSTCHHLRKVVNERAEGLSKTIVTRELTRLMGEASPPSFRGLTLLEAIRKWTLYYAGLRRQDIVYAAKVIARQYRLENGTLRQDEYDSSELYTLVDYLLQLDILANRSPPEVRKKWLRYKPRCEPGYGCMYELDGLRHFMFDMCSMDPRDRVIDMEVRRQTIVPKHVSPCVREEGYLARYLEAVQEYPVDILDGLMGKQDWLDMVRSVIEEPILQMSAKDKELGSKALREAIRKGAGLPEEVFLGYFESDFLRMAGLPPSIGLGKSSRFNYVPRMRVDVRGETQGQSRVLTTDVKAVRAVRRLAARRYGPSKGRVEQLLNPQNHLMRAALYEELLVLPRGEAFWVLGGPAFGPGVMFLMLSDLL